MGLIKLLIENTNKQLQAYIDRVKDNPNFKQWFKNSKVVDENGDPLIVFHATEFNFDEFADGDIGFHFGTSQAARDRIFRSRLDTSSSNTISQTDNAIIPTLKEFLDQEFKSFLENLKEQKNLSDSQVRDVEEALFSVIESLDDYLDEETTDSMIVNELIMQASPEVKEILNIQAIRKGARTGAYFLSIQNPIRTPDIAMWDSAHTIKDDLAGVFDDISQQAINKFDEIFEDLESYSGNDKEYLKQVVDLFKEFGYDGIVYENIYEGDGDDSYIVFDANQIKSIWNNGEFNANSNKVNEIQYHG